MMERIFLQFDDFPSFFFVLLLVCPAIKGSTKKKTENEQQKINSTNEKWNSSHKKRESAKSVRNPWGKMLEDYTTLNLLASYIIYSIYFFHSFILL